LGNFKNSPNAWESGKFPKYPESGEFPKCLGIWEIPQIPGTLRVVYFSIIVNFLNA